MGMGDEIMVTAHAKRLHQADGRKVVILDWRGNPRWHEIFQGNPRLAYEVSEEVSVITNGPRVRPYIKSKTDTKWEWQSGTLPGPGELYFTEEELAFAARMPKPDIVIEPNNKPQAPRNKDWGRERWKLLMKMMKNAGMVPFQFGTAAAQRLPGTEFIQTPTFRMACALLARARAAVLPEGGLHHAAAALGVKSVVIFGGYISPEVTGYTTQRNLFTGGGAGCGNRLQCPHCLSAMAAISPQEVFSNLEALL